MHENGQGMGREPKSYKIRGGGMVIYKSVIVIGGVSVLQVPSKPRDIMLFGKLIPGTTLISGQINRITNAIDEAKRKKE